MKETRLNVMGYDDMKAKVQFVFTSLSAGQAISYRYERVFEHEKMQLCAYHGMVRSETGSAGVMFARDTWNVFRDVVFGTSAFGLGEKALLNYDTLDAENKGLVDQRVRGYTSPKERYINKIAEGVATAAASLYLKVINNALGVHHKEFYINMIAEGVATLAASVCSKRIIVRLSDFKPSEYKSVIGGRHLEPDEESP